MTSWFYASEGKQEGPFSADQFRDLVSQGVIQADTLVWSEGMSGWQKASEIPGLLPATGAPAIQPRGGSARSGTEPGASPGAGNSSRTMDTGGGEFRIGIVLSQTFDVLKAKLGTFLLMALIPVLAFVIIAVVSFFVRGMTLGTGFMRANPSPGAFASIFSGFLIVSLLFGVVSLGSQAMIAYGTFQILSGRSFSFGDAFKHTSRRIIPIVGAVLLMWLAFNILLILIPAVMIPVAGSFLVLLMMPIAYFFAVTTLFVTIPVCTVEPLGSLASVLRSVELTNGYRWKIIGLFLVVFFVVFFGAIIAAVVMLVLGTILGAILATLVSAGSVGAVVFGVVVYAVPQTVFMLFIMAFFGVLPAATYSNLRMAKEGIAVADITNVTE